MIQLPYNLKVMGHNISSESTQKFQFIDGRDAQQSKFVPTNQQTSLQMRKQISSLSYEGPVNGELGQFTGLQQFIVPQKYVSFMKQNPLDCQPPKIKGLNGFDPYMFKKSLNVYDGQWKNGKPHGIGKIFNPDQDYYYEGYFQDGMPSYYGVFLAQNIQYRGQFKFGMAQGKGKYTQGSKTIIGEFKQNYPSRNCIQKAEDYTFSGAYEKGAWSKGKITWNEQKSLYEGQFRQGLMHGYGLLKTVSYVYQGNFKEGKKDGEGSIVWETGQNYKGEFRKDQIFGKGQLYEGKKLIYRGEFIQGRPHGQGWVYESQKLILSDWKEGKCIELL